MLQASLVSMEVQEGLDVRGPLASLVLLVSLDSLEAQVSLDTQRPAGVSLRRGLMSEA